MGKKPEPLNILVVDDNENRLTFFRNGLLPHRVQVCRHVQPAQSLLKKEPVDILFLDHDLEGVPAEPDSDNCGTALLRFLREKQVKVGLIVLHTENRAGREAMKELYPEALVIPYHTLKTKGLRSVVKNLATVLTATIPDPPFDH